MNTAAANKGVSVSVKDAIQTSRQKVNQKLYDQFGEQEKVTFLIKVKEQVDTNAVAKEADQKASLKKAAPAKAKSLKQSTIVYKINILNHEFTFGKGWDPEKHPF
ncbi:hypothetical protein G3A_05680 [Bacillus sp. 17376]|uniref:Uncharacterized protein n=1 Tax=Mesobacillus boroniphilus JCM 21738 TaxID=1294265 RepID=W4RUG3_9BACI|nr:hypothetical protein [Mesobacillus boroniphilus]ESU33694.1 hypothetical protein G3A_05680 [Bacillus sp. 17376]GAE47299.1 hypothetical protein JCM21738_4264 [Mesobacillus boroniphilus JCM 21738]